MVNTDLIDKLARQASKLEKRFSGSLTDKQLGEIAQIAAASYHILSHELMKERISERELLVRLGKRFTSIEFEANKKFYQHKIFAPSRSII